MAFGIPEATAAINKATAAISANSVATRADANVDEQLRQAIVTLTTDLNAHLEQLRFDVARLGVIELTANDLRVEENAKLQKLIDLAGQQTPDHSGLEFTIGPVSEK